MTKRILIIEDDYYLRRNLRMLLEGEGYESETAATEKEAMQYVLNGAFDLYLLDLWLPDGDGFDLLQKLRKRSGKPVIFLTVSDDEDTLVKALNLGADDYVTKPYRKAELLSRIAANLRRSDGNVPEDIVTAGKLVLNRRTSEVTLAGQDLPLRPADFQLLTIFLRNAGTLLTRDQLLTLLEADGFTDELDENALRVRIFRLRSKIGNSYIETVRGVGYRFRPDQARESQAGENLKREYQASKSQESKNRERDYQEREYQEREERK